MVERLLMHTKGMKPSKHDYTELSSIVCSVDGCFTRIKKKLVHIKKTLPKLCYRHHKEANS